MVPCSKRRCAHSWRCGLHDIDARRWRYTDCCRRDNSAGDDSPDGDDGGSGSHNNGNESGDDEFSTLYPLFKLFLAPQPFWRGFRLAVLRIMINAHISKVL